MRSLITNQYIIMLNANLICKMGISKFCVIKSKPSAFQTPSDHKDTKFEYSIWIDTRFYANCSSVGKAEVMRNVQVMSPSCPLVGWEHPLVSLLFARTRVAHSWCPREYCLFVNIARARDLFFTPSPIQFLLHTPFLISFMFIVTVLVLRFLLCHSPDSKPCENKDCECFYLSLSWTLTTVPEQRR